MGSSSLFVFSFIGQCRQNVMNYIIRRNKSRLYVPYIAPLKLEGEAGAKGVMSRFPDGEHRKGGRGLWYSFFYGLGLFSFS